MSEAPRERDVKPGRLDADSYLELFSDLHPPLDRHEAHVEADRCYFCYDAPCMTACPTEIDIPLFIREISADNPLGAAKTIFDQNIFGGMCARVCPTETLCEQACVRELAEGKPVKIGLLQRYATDTAMAQNKHFYVRAPSTGKRVAVVGAGPAGLACAHRLAMRGHEVDVYEAREKAGGLNEYGIAAYKTPENFAQAEVDYITAIGGITIHEGKALGRDIALERLTRDYDAVFLGMGLAGVNALGDADAEAEGSLDAVGWIRDLRQTTDLSTVPVGRRVVVIGGGMTAVDAAVQAKSLGADEVTICYRGPKERMKASEYEQEIAKIRGVTVRYGMLPKRMIASGGVVTGMEFERDGERVVIECDEVMKAIGQSFTPEALNGSGPSITLERGRIRVDAEGRTSMDKVWAGGDCVNAGDDLTVTAVAQGRDAAESIHTMLSSGAS
ncbi:NAD(P)-dependent oxidoreductase [Oricola cellulosilytica]|uniref:dihydrouracil dehydrogenase (NAD(+)) n=1 Tax=Oricola cellulosilytica TaxID=1429082 RepID=A0A4R0PBQ7_9HYPH|nr:NAD(P)-dependent oxidoreductase [Oricola cellulosilytica]TCD14891.1 NAD(P)-dependent oxidoreductase [Oricola cellulosilytica]